MVKGVGERGEIGNVSLNASLFILEVYKGYQDGYREVKHEFRVTVGYFFPPRFNVKQPHKL